MVEEVQPKCEVRVVNHAAVKRVSSLSMAFMHSWFHYLCTDSCNSNAGLVQGIRHLPNTYLSIAFIEEAVAFLALGANKN